MGCISKLHCLAQNNKEESKMQNIQNTKPYTGSYTGSLELHTKNLLKLTHTAQLENRQLISVTLSGEVYPGYYDKSSERMYFQKWSDSLSNEDVKYFVDREDREVHHGVSIDDVVITGEVTPVGTLKDTVVKYKAYKETLGTVEVPIQGLKFLLREISKSTIEYYNLMVIQPSPEIHIIGEGAEVDTIIEDTVEAVKDAKEHSDIMKEYHNVVAEISDAATLINKNTKLEDIADLQEVFLATREKLKDLSSSTQTKAQSIFDKFKGIPLIGRAITNTQELKQKTDSIQDHIDAMFITVHRQYERLVEIGEGLQKAKKKQEAQVGRLEALITASDAFLDTYKNPADIPIRELSNSNQIKTSYEKLKKRILKTEAAIMGTQASIIALGKNLPTSKAELSEELAISGLLNSVTDYQKMYQEVSELVNDVVTATSEKTYKVVENLLELQINDTHALTYLTNDTKRAKEFAIMITDKASKLADKTRKDAQMIKEVASGSSILEARAKIKALGYGHGE